MEGCEMSKKCRHLKPDDAGGLLDGVGHVVTSYVPDFEDCVLPYCTWYQDDFLGAVRGMKAAEIGIYTMLLNEMYESGRALDMPLDRLARRCGTIKKTLQASIKFFIEEGKIIQLDGGLWNGRVRKKSLCIAEKIPPQILKLEKSQRKNVMKTMRFRSGR